MPIQTFWIWHEPHIKLKIFDPGTHLARQYQSYDWFVHWGNDGDYYCDANLGNNVWCPEYDTWEGNWIII